MSELYTEALCDRPISASKITLDKRGLEWHEKLLQAIESRINITKLKALGWTRDQIVEQEPGYYYDEEYHELAPLSGYRRNKSLGDLSNAIDTYKGHSAWKRCGEGEECIESPCVIE